jgi:hypothetical protein
VEPAHRLHGYFRRKFRIETEIEEAARLHRKTGIRERVAGADLRRDLCVRRQCELKHGTLGYIRRSPYTSPMSLDDRTADR